MDAESEGKWAVGDRVFAPWEPQWLYPGTILCIDDDVAFLRFDDGDRGILPLDFLQSVSIRPGDSVFCRRQREEKIYYPAKVLGVTDDGLRVRYDDKSDDLVAIEYCRLKVGSAGDRDSESETEHGNDLPF